MEVTALCFRLYAALRIVPDRLQFFEYESVSFHCEGLSGSTLRGTRVNKELITKFPIDIKRTPTLTGTIQQAYESDSGVYWCENERGEKSNTVNITITTGSVILDSPALPVKEGDNVTLRCRSKTNSIDFTADFFKGGSRKSDSSREMPINNVSKSDEGLYNCSISGFGSSPGSWLAVRANSVSIISLTPHEEKHPLHHRSPHVFVPLWVGVTILTVALLLGLLHVRRHRVCGENVADDPDGVTYAVVVTKPRQNKDAADADDDLSLGLGSNHSREPQAEKGHNEQRHLTEDYSVEVHLDDLDSQYSFKET
ncbi:low affinity immunoglobulin gamma Fc region receptor III-A-like [Anoplopoma fimbria]|uniref:low affinity immunoglobulin gamma Fc region receptor III-A-like n=1 Tax=Anoplopoma fimbria TaxID=229290 RepID=UPI0023EA7A17|nr:low affinity immunoglobulin gamma Fc region receptor III-A-like [Anoplopoma fimbria]